MTRKRELDLYTMCYLKERMQLLSDMTTKCQGYQMLSRLIEETFEYQEETEKLRNK